MNCYITLLFIVAVSSGVLLWVWVGVALLMNKVKAIRVYGPTLDGPGEYHTEIDGESEDLQGYFIGDEFFYEVSRPAYQRVLGIVFLLIAVTMVCGVTACLMQ
jgi:hypothetical protein